MPLRPENRMKTFFIVSGLAFLVLVGTMIRWLHRHGYEDKATEFIIALAIGIKILSAQAQSWWQHKKSISDRARMEQKIDTAANEAHLAKETAAHVAEETKEAVIQAVNQPSPDQRAMPRTADELAKFITHIADTFCSAFAEGVKKEILAEKKREHEEMKSELDHFRNEFLEFKKDVRAIIDKQKAD